MELKMKPIKVVNTQYVIKVNNEVIAVMPSLREARQHIKYMPIGESTNIVHIVKQNTVETLLDTYEPRITKVLVASELDDELTLV